MDHTLSQLEIALHEDISRWWNRPWNRVDRFGCFGVANCYSISLEKRIDHSGRGRGVIVKQIWLAPNYRRRGTCTRLLADCLERLPGARFVLLENVLSAEMVAFLSAAPRYVADETRRRDYVLVHERL